jgi:hypothetical protein
LALADHGQASAHQKSRPLLKTSNLGVPLSKINAAPTWLRITERRQSPAHEPDAGGQALRFEQVNSPSASRQLKTRVSRPVWPEGLLFPGNWERDYRMLL